MPRSDELRLRDILDAIARIEGFIDGLSAASFRDDQRTLRAVAFDFVVIGESAANLSEEVRAATPEVPWAKVVGMRNLLAHQDFELDPDILWSTATVDLRPLVDRLEALLGSFPKETT